MQFNSQQEALFDWALTGSGSCNFIARAGTGKTTTIVELANRINPREKVFMGAFNKAIAEELKTRIKRPNVTAGTMHSLGLQLWRGVARGRSEIDAKKVAGIIKRMEFFPFDTTPRNILSQAIGYAKNAGFGLPDKSPENTENWGQIFDHYDLWDELPGSVSPDRMLEACVKVYTESLAMCREEDPLIDFDDMILAPLVYGEPKALYDWVMIDEAQDTNETRRRLAMSVLKPGGRLVAVGDPCQPTGTLVSVVLKKGHGRHGQRVVNVPIEDLKVGDSVVSYSQSDCAFVMGRQVLGVTKKPFKGRLIGVLTESGKTSEYTPNHHCLVNFSSLRKQHCVYVMRKDDRYRVGSSKMDYGSGIGGGPVVRVRAEDADAVWILKTFPSKQEAYIYENVVAANYGLPQLMFTTKNNSALVQESLDHIWARINPNHGAAVRCLMAHGREVAHPLILASSTYTSLKRPMIVKACNILPGCMMLPYKTGVHVHRKDWETVEVYEREYNGNVYSLTVEGEHLYCADGIITHNCQAIYGFAGANHDSMDLIKRDMGSVELPLSITYRCPKAVVALAQTLVPDIQAHETAPEGVVRTIADQQFWKEQLRDTDVILCRNTRPLIGVAKRLRKMGIPCAVEGANGKALISLASKWGENITIADMEVRLGKYVAEQVAKWEGKNRLDKSEAIRERQECLLDIASELEEFDSVASLVRHIDDMFGERYGEDNRRILRLCTVHRSKGREWDRVFLLGRNLYMPSRWAEKEWELGQEDNLVYVAYTRSKRELVEVVCRAKKNSEEPDWWEL